MLKKIILEMKEPEVENNLYVGDEKNIQKYLKSVGDSILKGFKTKKGKVENSGELWRIEIKNESNFVTFFIDTVELEDYDYEKILKNVNLTIGKYEDGKWLFSNEEVFENSLETILLECKKLIGSVVYL